VSDGANKTRRIHKREKHITVFILIEFMKIIDNKNLILDKKALIKITKEHPSGRNLYNDISVLVIELSNYNTEAIFFDDNAKNITVVTLFVFKNTESKDDFKSILYHEFFHVADRIDSKFKYSDKKKDALTEYEKQCVMELWNLYINTRLKDKGLFVVGKGSSLLKIRGKYQICHNRTTNVMLMNSINFLRTRGINRAEEIVRRIWGNPNHYLSYNDMVNITKNNRK